MQHCLTAFYWLMNQTIYWRGEWTCLPDTEIHASFKCRSQASLPVSLAVNPTWLKPNCTVPGSALCLHHSRWVPVTPLYHSSQPRELASLVCPISLSPFLCLSADHCYCLSRASLHREPHPPPSFLVTSVFLSHNSGGFHATKAKLLHSDNYSFKQWCIRHGGTNVLTGGQARQPPVIKDMCTRLQYSHKWLHR